MPFETAVIEIEPTSWSFAHTHCKVVIRCDGVELYRCPHRHASIVNAAKCRSSIEITLALQPYDAASFGFEGKNTSRSGRGMCGLCGAPATWQAHRHRFHKAYCDVCKKKLQADLPPAVLEKLP